MLTALTNKGKMISLVKDNKDPFLQKLKKEGKYYCPVCKEQVILKAGSYKIPHFSHQKRASCTFATEPESLRHMKGKRDLYIWLSKQNYKVYLEKYLSKIKQRPDILFKKNGKWFALEYQCSPISLESITERTSGYISCNIEPIWILGGNPYQHKYEQIYQLTDFQWSFIQASEKSGLCLFSYSPDDQHFHFLTHITSISSRKVTAVYSNRSLLKTSFPIYFPINEHTQYFDENWIKCKRNWIQQKLIYGEGFKDPFFLTMYDCLLHPLLLPPIIGFPVSFMGVCKTHPASWQFYIWYDSLRHLNVGDKIHYNHIQKGIDRRVALHHIQFRNPPFVPQTYRKRMIYHYLQVLVKNSYLKEIRKGIFILNRTITFPNNMEEAIVVENEFLNQSRN